MIKGTVSVRMIWPFMRAVSDFAPQLAALSRAGIDQATLADPDARIPRPLLGDLISLAVENGDVAIGIHAAERCESADFGVMDHAMRASPNVRRALECISRYTRLQDDHLEIVLVEDGDRVSIEFRNESPTMLRATNDFQTAVMVCYLWRRPSAKRIRRSRCIYATMCRRTPRSTLASFARRFATVVLTTPS